mmetsp:Transcript_80807/g.208057  ORF Transcript_80807/g.208057 Transcript_80807/m.208057 type:complete len:369 (+) Transcript_80807:132-1238(+)
MAPHFSAASSGVAASVPLRAALHGALPEARSRVLSTQHGAVPSARHSLRGRGRGHVHEGDGRAQAAARTTAKSEAVLAAAVAPAALVPFGHAAAVAGAAAVAVGSFARRRRRRACQQPRAARGGATSLRAVWSPKDEALEPGQLPPGLPPQLPKLTPAEILELRKGHRVQKQERSGNQGSGVVVLEVDAPPSVVLDCLQHFEDYEGMIPVVRKSKVISRQQAANGVMKATCHYRISKFGLGLSVIHHSSEAECPGGSRGLVRFDLDPEAGSTMVLREASGYWYVEPCPDGSGSRVWLQVGLQASCFVPHWLVDYAAERALRRATAWMRPHMEELWLSMQTGASVRQPTKEPEEEDLQLRQWHLQLSAC